MDLNVAGLVKMSTVDWPGKLVAVVFVQGCPWRCTYCHNAAILDPRATGDVPWQEVLGFLQRRRGLLDGVVFSGGEPTIDRALPEAIRQVRELGFEVALHTGGPWPQRLAAVLPLVDWVGLDIKHLPEKYADVTGNPLSGSAAWRSLDLLLASGVAHEVRTTVDPTVHSRADVLELVARLRARKVGGNRVQRHVLQEARPEGAAADHAAAFTNWRLADVVGPTEEPGVLRRAA